MHLGIVVEFAHSCQDVFLTGFRRQSTLVRLDAYFRARLALHSNVSLRVLPLPYNNDGESRNLRGIPIHH